MRNKDFSRNGRLVSLSLICPCGMINHGTNKTFLFVFRDQHIWCTWGGNYELLLATYVSVAIRLLLYLCPFCRCKFSPKYILTNLQTFISFICNSCRQLFRNLSEALRWSLCNITLHVTENIIQSLNAECPTALKTMGSRLGRLCCMLQICVPCLS